MQTYSSSSVNKMNCWAVYFCYGGKGKTLLHQLLVVDLIGQSDFDDREPLIKKLLKMHPEFPEMLDGEDKAPLFSIMKEDLEPRVKEHIVDFFCANDELGAKASASATSSLGLTASEGGASHALHLAIEEGVPIKRSILESPSLKKCLSMRNANGLTCLHLAMIEPFTDAKRDWAMNLVDINPDLLAVPAKRTNATSHQLTPLQQLTQTIEDTEGSKKYSKKGTSKAPPPSALKKLSKENEISPGTPKTGHAPNVEFPIHRTDTNRIAQSSETEVEHWKKLEYQLKLFCLARFDNATARGIMYRADQSNAFLKIVSCSIG